jgi:hypothetical protein
MHGQTSKRDRVGLRHLGPGTYNQEQAIAITQPGTLFHYNTPSPKAKQLIERKLMSNKSQARIAK